MEFNKMYQKVKYIVRKCEKEYYIQLWEKDDWEQEGQLTLFELYQKNPEIETNEELLYKYFKTKFRNHIKDKIRQQESDKRKINNTSEKSKWAEGLLSTLLCRCCPKSLSLC